MDLPKGARIGQRFGRWVVIGPSLDGDPYSVFCRCDCGTERNVRYRHLKNSASLSCGCIAPYLAWQRSDQEIGKTYGEWTVVEWRGGGKYLIRCSCGTERVQGLNKLKNGGSTSCGCVRAKLNKKYSELLLKYSKVSKKAYEQDGTYTFSLKQKVSKNSTTGVKGVSKMADGRYRAYINLRRKQHYLGVFGTIKEAKEAREEAEKELFDPIIKKHKRKNR